MHQTLNGLKTGGMCDEHDTRSSEFGNHINQVNGNAVNQ